ncbi:Mediator of RNA polymerase II transcription subunit 7 [Ptychographa xylographoides]|nr:Mediator of RNA polymerase II transcription subunit 7 [Ptychographa xylographoides]
MAEDQQNSSISAVFPPPPPFYKQFTEVNIARHAELQPNLITDFRSEEDSKERPHATIDLPSELRYLQPPLAPRNGQYRSFGEDRSLSPPLPPLPPEIEQLYQSPPTPQILIQLTRSILLNFLEYVHILATNPAHTEYGPKWDDLRDLFRNAHQAVNEYRPHQAREALIMMMEAQVERGKRERDGIRELREKVEVMLAGLGEGSEETELERTKRNQTLELDTENGGHDTDSIRERKLEAERRMWETLRENL